MRVSRRTLEALDWPLVAERLATHARTPGAQQRCRGDGGAGLFVDDADAMREALAETSEACAVLEAGAAPVGPVHEIEPALRRAERGGRLDPGALFDVAATIEAVDEAARGLVPRAEEAPRLAALASSLGAHGDLAAAIRFSIDSEGQVTDAASPEIAEARGSARRLGGEVQRRLEAALRDPQVAPHLSDSFVTVRHDRYVLPVRADARGQVRGIVHDASASGTTLFVEPQAVVDLNNRLKEAELRIEREAARVVRELSEQVGREASGLRASLAVLEALDLAFARAALAREQEAVAPEVGDAGTLRAPQLRHPLLPCETSVANDLGVGAGFQVLVLSGPNAGGKTVAMKALALAVLYARAGLHVTAAPGARVDWMDALLADIGDAQSLRESLSTFSAHLANLAHIVERAGPRTLVVLDEIGDGTDPGEGAALAQAVLEALADAGARVVATTHYNLLKEMAGVDPRFENGSFEFDAETLAPTYRIRLGTPGASSATAVAARMGLRGDVLERANQLLEREDRQLERMLAELSESRMALERERRAAEQARAESESDRDALRHKLERLQARRDKLYESMRRDLDQSFRRAHGEVARVIRELQRGGGARAAARAREELLEIEARARRTEAESGARPARPADAAPVDWSRARPGDLVRVVGGGDGALLALPDRRGRVAVRVGAARLVVPAERVAQPAAEPTPERSRPKPHVTVEARPPRSGAGESRCDLRGLRVEEALHRVAELLDDAAASGRARLVLIHGLGTGALRDAIRTHLADSPYVASFTPGPPEAGGDGLTEVHLEGGDVG
ncbi:MAG: Smr/MutS family protein [Myxococcota bacterium]|nr:Smr/MutS family protein [Myxococcota bacterium]